jgi:hypothetical protein
MDIEHKTAVKPINERDLMDAIERLESELHRSELLKSVTTLLIAIVLLLITFGENSKIVSSNTIISNTCEKVSIEGSPEVEKDAFYGRAAILTAEQNPHPFVARRD